MSAPVEIYRGVEIERTADILGFAPSFRDRFCISVRERDEDSAPMLDMFGTVEGARAAIDEFIEDETLAALKAAKGYMLNAKIDLETGAPKRTALATLNGGLRLVDAAIARAARA